MTTGAGTEAAGMVRSDEDGEEGGEKKGEDAEHFDSAPWMSEQREEAGGSNRRMMETIVVEALRNLWGNINEELLVYEERLEEVSRNRGRRSGVGRQEVIVYVQTKMICTVGDKGLDWWKGP